jgi:hypothetical protein
MRRRAPEFKIARFSFEPFNLSSHGRMSPKQLSVRINLPLSSMSIQGACHLHLVLRVGRAPAAGYISTPPAAVGYLDPAVTLTPGGRSSR